LFCRELIQQGLRTPHLRHGDLSWLLEDNHLIVKSVRALGATERMRWRLYERSTTPQA
jgi:hypothetical protein